MWCFFIELLNYAKTVMSFLTIIVTRSMIQNSGQTIKFKIAPKILPLCTLVMMPQITLVTGMIAKIKQIIQSNPKYLFELAII